MTQIMTWPLWLVGALCLVGFWVGVCWALQLDHFMSKCVSAYRDMFYVCMGPLPWSVFCFMCEWITWLCLVLCKTVVLVSWQFYVWLLGAVLWCPLALGCTVAVSSGHARCYNWALGLCLGFFFFWSLAVLAHVVVMTGWDALLDVCLEPLGLSCAGLRPNMCHRTW